MKTKINTLKLSDISFFIAFTITFLLTSCGNDPFGKVEKSDDIPKTTIQFDKTSHDFGNINNGEKQQTTFKYTNTGDNPLIITDIKTTCGCTVPSWEKSPLEPGKSAEFTVSFDGKGANKITKSVTVTSNTKKGQDVVRISAFIINPNSVKQPMMPKVN